MASAMQEEEEEAEVEAAARVLLRGRRRLRRRMRLTFSSAEKASNNTACPRSCPCKLRQRPSRAPRGCSRGICRAGLLQNRRRRRWNADAVRRRRHQSTPTPTPTKTPIERMLRRRLLLPLLRRGSAPGRSSLPRPLRRSPSLVGGSNARRERGRKLGAKNALSERANERVFFSF